MSRRAVVLSAVPVSTALCRYVQPGDFVVACDAGYRNAERLDLRPDLIVGDFDSAPQPKTEHETIVLPHVKDDTDTQYAAHWLLEHGYDEIILLGALGGARLEHTLANLATGLYLAKNGVNVLLANERSELRYLVPGRELICSAGTGSISPFPDGGPADRRLHLRCVLPAGKRRADRGLSARRQQ